MYGKQYNTRLWEERNKWNATTSTEWLWTADLVVKDVRACLEKMQERSAFGPALGPGFRIFGRQKEKTKHCLNICQ